MKKVKELKSNKFNNAIWCKKGLWSRLHHSFTFSLFHFFTADAKRSQRGNMMVEMLLAVALAAAMLPFLVRSQKARVQRAEDVRAAADMRTVKSVLEKYIDARKNDFAAGTSRMVTRVKMSDLEEFGLVPESINKPERFQLRVIKTAERNGRASLQGIVIMDADNITPMRTREIAGVLGESGGFAEGGKLYGAYGTWGESANIWNARFSANSVLDITGAVGLDGGRILRIASNDKDDATMQSDLSMGGHSVRDAQSISAESATFAEILNADSIESSRAIFETRPALSGTIAVSGETYINGALISDGRAGLQVEKLSFQKNANLGSVLARELWAGDLNLSGIAVSGDGREPAILSVNRTIDMMGGHISAMLVAVGYAGSITPKLVVYDRLEDPGDDSFFWDFGEGRAVFRDLSLSTLGQMMRVATVKEGAAKSGAGGIVAVTANANATVADFENALSDMESRVRQKYNQLNLE